MDSEIVETSFGNVNVLRNRSEGPPLLLLHGAGASKEVWRPIFSTFASFTAVAPSLPGRDGTEEACFEDLSRTPQWLEAVMDAVGFSRALILGHSMGGAIALEAAMASSRVSGVILVSSGARLRIHPGILASVEAAITAGTPLDLASAVLPPEITPVLQAYVQFAAQVPLPTVLADWQATDRFDRMMQLATLDLPTLVIGGSADTMTPIKYQRYLAEHLPRATLVELEGVGHLLPWETPAMLAQHVRTWASAVVD